jgi:hypothetical protein
MASQAIIAGRDSVELFSLKPLLTGRKNPGDKRRTSEYQNDQFFYRLYDELRVDNKSNDT